MSSFPPGWTQDAQGNWARVPSPGLSQVAAQTAQFVADRAGETSTQISAATGVAIAPTLIQHAGIAIAAGLSGDFVTCALNATPILLGGIGLLKVALTPDKPKGPTDDEIKSHIATLSRDELISLLANASQVPAAAANLQPGATGGANVSTAG